MIREDPSAARKRCRGTEKSAEELVGPPECPGGRFYCLKNFTPKTQVIVSVAAAGSPMAGFAASYAAASAP